MKKSKGFKLAVVFFTVIGLLATSMAFAGAKGEPVTVQGVVDQGDKGVFVINTDDGQTLTIVGQNLKEMVGKKVKITGTLTKSKKNKAIVATAFEEIQ